MQRARPIRTVAAIALGLLCSGLVSPQLDAQPSSEANDPAARYERARTLSLSGETEAALAAFDALLADFPDDADYLLGRAQMQARLGWNAAAVETAEQALALAPNYEDVWQLRLQLAERTGDDAAALRAQAATRFPEATWWQAAPAPIEYRHWLSAGSGTDRLSNGAPDWSRQFIRVDWDTAEAGLLFAEVSSSERFDESDSSLYLGGNWLVLPMWQLGTGVAITEDARFLPDRELSVDASRSWAAGWGTAFGFRQRDYASGDVASYSFTGEKYVSDYRIAYRLDHSRQAGIDDSALTHVLSLTWYPSDRRNVGVTLGAGEEIEVIGLDQLLHTSVSNITVAGSERFSPRLALSWWLGTHEQGDFYRRDYAGLSVRIGL